jgi:hypothetical protein
MLCGPSKKSRVSDVIPWRYNLFANWGEPASFKRYIPSNPREIPSIGGFSCLIHTLNPHVETPKCAQRSPLPDYDAQSASTERGKRHLSGRSLGLKLEALVSE